VAGSWLKTGLVTAGVLALSWGSAIHYWRGSGAAPTGMDLLVWLGVVPAGLLAGGWGLRALGWRLADASRTRLSRAPAAASPAPATGAPAAESVPADAVPGGHAVLAGGALWLACADDPAQIALHHADLPRPGLHPRLRDRDGLPVFAAHVPGLDTGEVEAVLQAHGAGGLRAEPLRALVLLQPVAEALLCQAATSCDAPVREEPEAAVVAGLRRPAATRACPPLPVWWLVPADWDELERRAGECLLQAWAQECGLPAGADVRTVPVADAAAGWQALARVLDRPDTAPAGALVLAATSQVGEMAVAHLQARGRLFQAATGAGVLPGEGAAGLLLAGAGAGTDTAGDGAAVYLHRPASQELPDAGSARLRAAATGELLRQALARAGVEASTVSWAVSDAGQAPEPAVEAASALLAACPDLDTYRDGCALAALAADLGAVLPLAQLAAAQARVAAHGTPALVLSVDAPRRRIAAVVAPASLPPADPAAASAEQAPFKRNPD
jgi:hypothetical protein